MSDVICPFADRACTMKCKAFFINDFNGDDSCAVLAALLGTKKQLRMMRELMVKGSSYARQ